MEFIKLHGCAHDLAGRRFGRLVALGPIGRIFRKARGTTIIWLCECDCGRVRKIDGKDLRSGNTKSCGCYNIDTLVERSTTHGLTALPEFWVWNAAKRRCHTPSDKAYHRYGGRGIQMCQRWQDDFGAFMEDMGPRPTPEHTLERLNNDLGYNPANCAWRLPIVQANNKSNNRFIEAFGRRQTVAQWAREIGMKPGVLHCRLFREGWEPERALREPIYKPTILLVEAFGKSMTCHQWAKEVGLSAQLIRSRLDRGWPPELALKKPPQKQAA